MNLEEQIRDEASKLLLGSKLVSGKSANESLEKPPNPEMGDIASNISFMLAKEMRKPPNKIAEEIASSLKIPKGSLIEKIEAKGGYVNFFLDYEKATEKLLKEILKEKERYGSQKKNKKDVLIEYSAPNPNKPMHIGHTRNNFIGVSISNVFDFVGYETHPVNWINDRGSHICKSLWGYLQFGKKDGPEKIGDWKNILDEWFGNQDKWMTPKDAKRKPDYFVMDYYVKASNEMKSNEDYDKQNRELLQEWEDGNEKVRALWKKLNSWAYEGWDETYKRQGCKFEKWYYESEIYKNGKELVFKNMDKGIFFKSNEGTIVADLEKQGLPGMVFIRSDGTSLYQTADLALTKEKVKDYPKAKLIWVVGGGQKLYFQQLFEIFELLGLAKKEDCYHLDYGMVSLPEGKMSSREGKVILADDLMNEVYKMVEVEVEKRNPDLPEKKKREITEKIMIGAIKYAMLKIDAFKEIIFDPKEVVKFEGNTGPYLQYSHVRASKILEKAGNFLITYTAKEMKREERELMKQMMEFPSVVLKTAKEYKPNLIANYAYDLAEKFSSFYHSCPVIQAKDKETKHFRLTLTKAFRTVMENSLTVLGIEMPDMM
jgi:arginyl-tRNA synthetase